MGPYWVCLIGTPSSDAYLNTFKVHIPSCIIKISTKVEKKCEYTIKGLPLNVKKLDDLSQNITHGNINVALTRVTLSKVGPTVVYCTTCKKRSLNTGGSKFPTFPLHCSRYSEDEENILWFLSPGDGSYVIILNCKQGRSRLLHHASKSAREVRMASGTSGALHPKISQQQQVSRGRTFLL